MKSQARAVVIGGGAVGVATLYHLTKKGWSDVVLLERKELTSGSTWHAAGLLPLFNMSYSVGQIHKYSVALYKRLEAETGQDVGLRQCSNIRLALNRDRMDEYHQYAGVAETIGVKVEFLTPSRSRRSGRSATSRAWSARSAIPRTATSSRPTSPRRWRGARARRRRDLPSDHGGRDRAQPSGEWLVRTDQGDIACEHVVSATGNFARQTGAMVGLDVPVIPVEHQYIVTEPHPAIVQRHKDGLPEMGVLRESDGSWYMREEAGGLLLGPYERGRPAATWTAARGRRVRAVPRGPRAPDPAHRGGDQPRAGVRRGRGQAGVQRRHPVHAGRQPDHRPGLGPAELLAERGPQLRHHRRRRRRLAARRVDRRGRADDRHAGRRPAALRRLRDQGVSAPEERGGLRQRLHHPLSGRGAPGGRPLRMAPCYERMQALGAVFGQKFGWERPNWFAPEGHAAGGPLVVPALELVRARRQRVPERRQNVGLLDMTAFAKARVSVRAPRRSSTGWSPTACRSRSGGVHLCHALNTRGGVHSEFTIMREAQDSFYLVSAGAWQRLDHDWLKKHMPDDGSVRFENLTNAIGVLVVAGPKARELLQRVSETDFSRRVSLAHRPGDHGRPGAGTALRVNFVGELGWELHHPIEYQNHIFDALMAAGEDLGLKPFGIRAMDRCGSRSPTG